MKALQFVLFCLFASTESFHIASPSVIPYLPKPDFVCATFPFCYQELETGDWKSMTEKNQLNTTGASALPRYVPVEESECWLDGYYCRSDASNLITRIKLDTAEECQQKCADEKYCEYFSLHETRGQGYCSLLSECVVNRKCSDSEMCATGGKNCDCQKLDYFPGNKDSLGISRWTCEGGLDPYTSDIKTGITCFARCPAWKDSTLQSTCLKNGKWSATAPAGRRSLTYAASYPTPDQPDMECGCNEVGPYYYDPNTESGARFVCDGRDQDEYKKAGGWTIKNTDKCELFCSEASEPVVSVYCDAATWRGAPELGFWCYDKPENPGPQELKEIVLCPSDWKLFGSHCYKHFENQLSWLDAEKHCQKEKGHLTSIHSKGENDFVNQMTDSDPWLGINDINTEGSFDWSDNSAANFEYWSPGNPDNAAGNQDCGRMYPTGTWDDDLCDKLKTFICKKDIEDSNGTTST